MKWILNLNKKYRVPYILSNLFLIFFDSIGFVMPILVGYLVDSVTIRHNYDSIFFISIFPFLASFLCIDTFVPRIRFMLSSKS